MPRISSSNNLGSLLSCSWWLAQHALEKRFLQVSAVNESLQSLLRNISHSCLFSIGVQSCNSLSSGAKILLFVSFAKFFKIVVIELQGSHLTELLIEEAYHE